MEPCRAECLILISGRRHMHLRPEALLRGHGQAGCCLGGHRVHHLPARWGATGSCASIWAGLLRYMLQPFETWCFFLPKIKGHHMTQCSGVQCKDPCGGRKISHPFARWCPVSFKGRLLVRSSAVQSLGFRKSRQAEPTASMRASGTRRAFDVKSFESVTSTHSTS